MTEQEFLEKVEEMADTIKPLIMKKAKGIVNSGALPLSDYGNTYELPKAFMSAMGQEIQWQYRPLTKEIRDIANNLNYFI